MTSISRLDAGIAAGMALAIALFCATGLRAFWAQGGMPTFYQSEFGPAALYACGRGFTSTSGLDEGQTDPQYASLHAFLGQRRARFDCGDLPQAMTPFALNSFQSVHRNLLWLAGLTWRVFGVSWPALAWLAGSFVGASVSMGYLLCRIGMGRPLSVLMTLLWGLSPLQLSQAPNLRDYAKAPFFLLTISLAAFLASYRIRAVPLYFLMAGAGVVLGFGLGVRTDVLLYLPVVVVALVAFRPGPVVSDLRARTIGAVLAVGGFLIVAQPVLRTYQSANNVAHVALLGFTDSSDEWLGLNRAPYSFGYAYDDGYIATVVSAYHDRVDPEPAPLRLSSKPYETASNAYYALILRTFPGDMITRGWAAVIQVLGLPFRRDTSLRPDWVPPRWDPFYQWRLWLLQPLGGIWILAATLALIVSIGGRSIRSAVLFFCLLTGLSGITALQFQGRHVFHLEIVPLWIYGCLAAGLWRTGAAWLKRDERPPAAASSRWNPLAGLGVGLAVVGVIVTPVAAARHHQVATVRDLLGSYSEAALDPLSTTERQDGSVAFLDAAVPIETRLARTVLSDMVVVQLGGEVCDYDVANLTFRYRSSLPFPDLSHQIQVPVPGLHDAPTRLFFPVFSLGARYAGPRGLAFTGVEVPIAQRGCIVTVERFKEPDRFPLLLEVIMPPQWRDGRRYQTVRAFEMPDSHIQWTVHTQFNPETYLPGRRLLAALSPMTAVPTFASRQIGRLEPGRLDVRGTADSAGAYLVTWPYSPRVRGSAFYVEGELLSGGLTVGVQRDEKWVAQVNIDEPGSFRAAVVMPNDGTYGPIIANHLTRSSLTNRFVVTRYGWLPPVAD